ncbi:unnamed protein product [Echinostoma caproni]|uniref:PKP3 n=1 Tax=Echinostoma caproni TaxID=27848 RepID=A0A183ATN5_9TREM|nr:unnamed protein product [Echinostoma caproni]
MTSHRTRMQYEQQRQLGFARNDSASSLRSGDPLQTPSGSSIRGPTRTGYAEPSGSVISGSYLSSKPRSYLSGTAASATRNHENYPESTVQPESVRSPSVGGPRSQVNHGTASASIDRLGRAGSVTSYQPSTMMGKSVYGTRSLYGASQLKMSRSLKASKVSDSIYPSSNFSEPMADAQEKLVSGQTSKDALTRAPIGSRTTLVIP